MSQVSSVGWLVTADKYRHCVAQTEESTLLVSRMVKEKREWYILESREH